MIRWTHLDTAPAVDGAGELRLMRRGDEFSIMIGANELMNSRLGGSEAALATLACARIEDREAPHVLIGGLGMGFTLRAALGRLGPGARVVVAELLGAVVAWATGPLSGVFGDCLADPRVEVREADVWTLITAAPSTYDAILLDVDNGPEGLVRPQNDRLYDAAGLRAARAALRPGGVLAVWSSAPDAAFTRRLRHAGFDVTEAAARGARSGRGSRHVIWVAASPDGRPG